MCACAPRHLFPFEVRLSFNALSIVSYCGVAERFGEAATRHAVEEQFTLVAVTTTTVKVAFVAATPFNEINFYF